MWQIAVLLWMAERLMTLPTTQVAWVRLPVPARPTFSVVKWLFSVTLRQAPASSTAIELIKWVKIFAVYKVCGDLRLD
jgi:hypothetical protein